MANDRTQELKEDNEFIELIKTQQIRLGFSNARIVRAEVENLSGNINRVRRIKLQFEDGTKRSFVVKHVPAEGRLERYPEIVFPDCRLNFEVLWFGQAEQLALNEDVKTPHVFYFDQRKRLMIMEDLEPRCSFGEFLRQKQNAAEGLLASLGKFLARVHSRCGGAGTELANPSAALNRPYVFTLPLVEPDKMRSIWEAIETTRSGNGTNSSEISLAERTYLQELYLNGTGKLVLPLLSRLEGGHWESTKKVLTHGDLHTESVLVLANDRLGVVDAELCEFWCPGFDLGMFAAHLWANRLVSGIDKKEIEQEWECFMTSYANEFLYAGRASKENLGNAYETMVDLYESSAAHCGAEILRRLLGAAGFAFALSREQFEELLEDGSQFLLAASSWSNKFLEKVM